MLRDVILIVFFTGFGWVLRMGWVEASEADRREALRGRRK